MAIVVAGAAFLAARPASAFAPPGSSGPHAKEFKNAALDVETSFKLPSELTGDAAAKAASDLSALGVGSDRGRIDVRSGRWATITPSQPLIPGSGVANTLTWQGLGGSLPPPSRIFRPLRAMRCVTTSRATTRRCGST
ncbi:MAG: hypothetical protein IPK07_28150 [Deltaproteobacteria bacterium]|nr:hypothetical protein [Deltaproteobacteria bacterium]